MPRRRSWRSCSPTPLDRGDQDPLDPLLLQQLQVAALPVGPPGPGAQDHGQPLGGHRLLDAPGEVGEARWTPSRPTPRPAWPRRGCCSGRWGLHGAKYPLPPPESYQPMNANPLTVRLASHYGPLIPEMKRFNPPTPGAWMAPLLVLEHATKAFGAVQALEDGSIELQAGEAHALIGENGAGKSTLVKILAGVYRPDSGRLLLDGRELRLANPADARDAGIAVIYQEPTLFPDLSVAENIFMGRQPLPSGRRIDGGEMR